MFGTSSMARRAVLGLLLLAGSGAGARAEPPPLPAAPVSLLGLPGSAMRLLTGRREDLRDLLDPRTELGHPEDATKEREGFSSKLDLRGKIKDCCGYPLGASGSYKISFYWLAWEADYANEPYDTIIYTRHGFPIGSFPRTFVFELKMEGSGVLRDGRILNYDGRCGYGVGVCFAEMDVREHPLGKGGQNRPLQPFRSVAVDPRFIALGTPIYLPELRGVLLPDGTPHDGCVRADDTGGNIQRRELDFFVESHGNWKLTEERLLGDLKVTPYVEEPRCAYLANFDPVVDRRSTATDWAALHQRGHGKPAAAPAKHGKLAKAKAKPAGKPKKLTALPPLRYASAQKK